MVCLAINLFQKANTNKVKKSYSQVGRTNGLWLTKKCTFPFKNNSESVDLLQLIVTAWIVPKFMIAPVWLSHIIIRSKRCIWLLFDDVYQMCFLNIIFGDKVKNIIWMKIYERPMRQENKNKKIPVMSVVRLESKIEANARLNPVCTASRKFFPRPSSSLIRS